MTATTAQPEINLAQALSAPFAATEVHFKPAVVSGNRALALAYVDARSIMDRLDDVVGVGGWTDSYDTLPDGSVVCRLSLRLGGEWITKTDVGGPSEQSDEGDRRKAAVSDALKRAAVKFGIGRYLYRLPAQWVDWDAHKRRFIREPVLPTNGNGHAPTTANGNGKPTEPTFQERLQAFDAELAKRGLCRPGDCVKHVQDTCFKCQMPAMDRWGPGHFGFALGTARDFEQRCKKRVATNGNGKGG